MNPLQVTLINLNIENMSVLTNLKWRYATKRMNGQKIPSEKVEIILEAIQLAPTSIGLQPFTVVVVEDPEMRAKIAPAIYNQPQITEGSHVLVFAAWNSVTETHIDAYMQAYADRTGIPVSKLIELGINIIPSIKIY